MDDLHGSSSYPSIMDVPRQLKRYAEKHPLLYPDVLIPVWVERLALRKDWPLRLDELVDWCMKEHVSEHVSRAQILITVMKLGGPKAVRNLVRGT